MTEDAWKEAQMFTKVADTFSNGVALDLPEGLLKLLKDSSAWGLGDPIRASRHFSELYREELSLVDSRQMSLDTFEAKSLALLGVSVNDAILVPEVGKILLYGPYK